MAVSRDEQAFLNSLSDNPLDQAGRGAYADWLDEQDRPDEATRQRKWVVAVQELSRYSRAWQDSKFVGYDESRLGKWGDPEPVYKSGIDKEGHDGIVREAGEWGTMVEGKDTYFGPEPNVFFATDAAQELMRNRTNREKFFAALEVVTGVKAPAKLLKQEFFRCAC